ncbi:MAG: exo-alpha-sialidase, partial [Betaproteobacteria bacterium]|nr:exo-alpha-sialidase [Betaproteobacteria bacterium]
MLLSADLPGGAVPEILRNNAPDTTAPITVNINPGPASVDPNIATPAGWLDTPERVWTVSGSVDGGLTGGDNDRDTFIIGPDATVSGLIDGGAGGFDSLVIAERRVTIAIFDATGPSSGTVRLDDQTIAYANMEPLPDNTIAPDKVLNLATAGADTFRVFDGVTVGTLLIDSLNGTFEDHTLREPQQNLLINANAGDDVINFDALLFDSRIVIDGGEGNDTVDVSGRAVSMTAVRQSDGTILLVEGTGPAVELRNVETVLGASFTLTANGVPNWVEQGPGGIGNAAGFPLFRGQPWAGAIQAIADHPLNSNILFVGTVNGGVWRSTDAGATWSTTTDQFPSLAIGALAVSTHDNTGALVTAATPVEKLVVYAGTGQFSNQYTGGQSVGLMRSVNGGATWELVTPPDMAGLPIASIVATRDGTQDVVVVGTIANSVTSRDDTGALQTRVARAGGVFRSTDGGQTFTKSEIVAAPAQPGVYHFPVSSVTSIVQDPGNLSRLYMGVVGGGVYQSDNAGATWTNINGTLGVAADGVDNDAYLGVDNPEEGAAGAARIVLSVRENRTANDNPVYAALIGTTDWLMGVWRKAPASANWALVGTNPPPRDPMYAEDVSMSGGAAVDIVAGASPTITRKDAGGSFVTDGFVANREIAVTLPGGTATLYRVTAVTATTLTLAAGSNIAAGAGVAGAVINQVSRTPIQISGNPTLTIASGGTAGVITITRPAGAGTWGADGFMPGHLATVSGTVNNNGRYFVTAATPTVLTLRSISNTPAAFVAEPAPAAGIVITGALAIPSTPGNVQPQVHVGQQGQRNFALAVDAAENVFIGGDTAQLGTNLFWWDNRAAPNGQVWRPVMPTGTHPDARVITFDSTGRILQSDDGGVYRMPNPATTAPATARTAFTFANGASSTITRTVASGSFVTDGFQAGMRLFIRNAQDNGTLANVNFGQYTIASVTAQTITLAAGDSLSSALIGTFTVTLEGIRWEVLNNGIRAVEVLSAAYDPL